MRGGQLGYDYSANPTGHRSFVYLTCLIYRLSEFCQLVSGVIPGFCVRLSHLGVLGYSQHIFRTHALEQVSAGQYKLKSGLFKMIRAPVLSVLTQDIFDLA